MHFSNDNNLFCILSNYRNQRSQKYLVENKRGNREGHACSKYKDFSHKYKAPQIQITTNFIIISLKIENDATLNTSGWWKTVSGGLGCTSTPDFDLLSLQTLFFFYKKKDIPLLILIPLIFKLKPLKPSTKNSKISKMGVLKRRVSSSRGLGGVLREQRAKLYIIKRCVVMLLCWQDWSWLFLSGDIPWSWTGSNRWLQEDMKEKLVWVCLLIVDLGGWKFIHFWNGYICFRLLEVNL